MMIMAILMLKLLTIQSFNVKIPVTLKKIDEIDIHFKKPTRQYKTLSKTKMLHWILLHDIKKQVYKHFYEQADAMMTIVNLTFTYLKKIAKRIHC